MQEAFGRDILKQLFSEKIFSISEYEPVRLMNLERQEVDAARLLVVLKEMQDKEMGSAIELARKMVDWLGLKREEVAFINIAENQVSFTHILSKKSITEIICCGISPAEIGLQIEHLPNMIIRFMHCKLIFTSSFSEMRRNEALKQQFFNEARKMFDLPKASKS